MTKYSINKNYIYQIKNNKNILIFDNEKSIILELNETATVIFNKLKFGWREKQIKDFLFSKFKVKKELVNNQVSKTIKNLLKNKILIH